MFHQPPFIEAVCYPFLILDYGESNVKLTNPYVTWRLRIDHREEMEAACPVGTMVFLFEPPKYYWN